MQSLQIHHDIKEKLKYFHQIQKIPNIIFSGSSGSGRSTIVHEFINIIYDNNREKIKANVMFVNCAHGAGIKFIREDLSFFAKTHINSHNGHTFKSIVFFNADKLTLDAQTALRRCIEIFSHSTRFFIVIEDKNKLIKPILSRFCEIFVSFPIYPNTQSGKPINLYSHNLEQTFQMAEYKRNRLKLLKKDLDKNLLNTQGASKNISDIFSFVEKLYEKGYSVLDILELLRTSHFNIYVSEIRKYELLFSFDKMRREIRNEKLIMAMILHSIIDIKV